MMPEQSVTRPVLAPRPLNVESETRASSATHGQQRHGIEWRELLRSRVFQTVGIAVLFTIATWPPADVRPTPGLDPSWQAGLSMASVRHLQWGPRMDFTYGPLGFLSQPTLYFGSTAEFSLAYLGILHLAVFALLIHFLRKSFTLPIALLFSYLIGATCVAAIDPGDLIVVPITLSGILVIQSEPPGRHVGVLVLGVIAGACLLEKFGDGVIAVVILGTAIASNPNRIGRRTDAAVGGLTLVTTVIVAWVVTGNGLKNLPGFLRSSLALASGYSSAMQTPPRPGDLWYVLVVLAVVGIFAVMGVWNVSTRTRVASTVVILTSTWWALKEGFVRPAGHELIFFAFMLVLITVAAIPTPKLRPQLVVAMAFVMGVTWAIGGSAPSNVLGVLHDANGLRSELATVIWPSSRNSAIDLSRSSMQQKYGLNRSQVNEVIGHTTAIEPFENDVAWAYPSVSWDPEPTLQAYSAYTSSLDELDANFLRSRSAPSTILQQAPIAIDGRDPFFEPPTTWVTMMCHYVQFDATIQWQVLRQVPDRCGPVRLIKHVTAEFDQKVRVPSASAGDAVVARFVNLPLSLGYKVSSILLKPPTTSIATNAGTYRFIVGTANDLHLLRPSSSLGYSAPFRPPSLDSVELSGAGAGSGAQFEIDFYLLKVDAG